MKILIVLTDKNKKCRTWTNGNLAQYHRMASSAFYDVLKHLVKNRKLTWNEVIGASHAEKIDNGGRNR